jgi:hypothetical protein
MRDRVSLGLLVASSLIGFGCASATPKQPPGRPPAPETVSVAEPGGDAADAHEAALLRQLSSPWGRRTDKDDQLEVPLLDWEHWKRVRFHSVEHFVGFRYGNDHHVASIVLVQDGNPGEELDSRRCLKNFELWARQQLAPYDVQLGLASERELLWHGAPIFVRSVDGSFSFAFMKRAFSAAWAAYPAYPGACLVYAVAVPWDTRPKLAQRVRDRWAAEGFQQMTPLTRERPYRK